MAITTLKKHNDCETTIRRTLFSGPHFAELRCLDCDKHIQWLSENVYNILRSNNQGANNNE